MKKISIVVPVFNEIESIDNFVSEVNDLDIDFELIFACDPSTDGTEEKLKDYSKNSDGKEKLFCLVGGSDNIRQFCRYQSC